MIMFVIAVWNLDRFLPSFTEVKVTEHRTMYQCIAVGALREREDELFRSQYYSLCGAPATAKRLSLS